MRNRFHPRQTCVLTLLLALVASPFARAAEAKPKPAAAPVTAPSSTAAPAPVVVAAPAATPSPAPAPMVENSVVKVFATMRYPDPFKPWTKQAPNEISGTGVFRCRVPRFPFEAGAYRITLFSTVEGDICDWVIHAATLDVEPGDYFGTGKMNVEGQGHFLVEHRWEATR